MFIVKKKKTQIKYMRHFIIACTVCYNLNIILGTEIHNYLEMSIRNPLKYIMDYSVLIVFICLEKFIQIQRVNRLLGGYKCILYCHRSTPVI